MRATLACLALTCLLLFCASALASPPPDYSMTTEYRNPDGTVTHVTRDYLRDGVMHRREHIGGVELHLEAHVESEVQLDSDDKDLATTEELAATTVQLPLHAEPYLVTIDRSDLDIGWTLDTESLTYDEHAVDPQMFSWSVDITFREGYERVKIGETSVLGYECDIYDVTQTVVTETAGTITYTNIVTVARDLNVVLKTELLINGVPFQATVVTQFSLEKPDESLFVVPAGYSKR